MTPKQRWMILGGLLLATLTAGYMADDEPVQESAKKKNSASSKKAVIAIAGENGRAIGKDKAVALAAGPLVFPEPVVAQAEAASEAVKVIDPFRNKSWYLAPAPPPPPKPTAPPLPFQYQGKLAEGGETRVFLNHQGKYLIVSLGDVINGTYTVEEITSGRVTFLYQPLKERQVLTIGAEN